MNMGEALKEILGTRNMRLGDIDSLEKSQSLKKGARTLAESGCSMCLHRRSIGDYGRVQCSHPKVMEIQERFPQREPGLIAAKALNAMGKALDIRINPEFYKNPWFNWPWCYDPASVEFCSGFGREAEAGVREEKGEFN